MTTRKNILKIVLLILFGTVIGIFSKLGYFHNINLAVSHDIQSAQPGWFITFSQFVSIFEFGVAFIVIPLFFYLLSVGKRAEAYVILISGLTIFVSRLVKLVFGVACPSASEVRIFYTFHDFADFLRSHYANIPIVGANVCFPSGHVFDYLALWGSIYILRKEITPRVGVQNFLAFFSIFLLCFVGISRLSLGAHFLSDVVGGYLLGGAWLMTLILIYKKYLRRR